MLEQFFSTYKHFYNINNSYFNQNFFFSEVRLVRHRHDHGVTSHSNNQSFE